MQEDRQEPEKQGEEEPKLQVDEDWKKSVQDEKQRLRAEEQDKGAAGAEERPQRPGFPEPSIQVFMAGLYTQTLIALGEIENPVTKSREGDTDEAAYLIDTIDMLRQKTEGNLAAEETAYVDSLLADLRMRYVRATSEEPAEAAEQE